jgi:hypothetical protein
VDGIDEVAQRLYALAPAEFTAARDAAARDEGDRARRAAITRLRKPVAAAYAVNLLARRSDGPLGDALSLSAELREAQEDLDGAELARLGRQRRSLVAALAAQAVRLAEEQGVSVSSAARDDVVATLNAAVSDAGAAAAVLTGRLVRPLAATGLEPPDLDGAVAGTAPAPAADASSGSRRDELAERRARREAAAAARAAEAAATQAERALAAVEGELGTARDRSRSLDEQIERLTAELDRARREADALAPEVDRLQEQRREAAAAARKARASADRARDEIDGA